jgi:hypothetical protein
LKRSRSPQLQPNRVSAIGATLRVLLAAIPTNEAHGKRATVAFNGLFGKSRFHPLFAFPSAANCLRAKPTNSGDTIQICCRQAGCRGQEKPDEPTGSHLPEPTKPGTPALSRCHGTPLSAKAQKSRQSSRQWRHRKLKGFRYGGRIAAITRLIFCRSGFVVRVHPRAKPIFLPAVHFRETTADSPVAKSLGPPVDYFEPELDSRKMKRGNQAGFPRVIHVSSRRTVRIGPGHDPP